MTDEWLYFASGFLLASFVASLLFVYEVVIFKPRPARPDLLTWRRLDDGEEEIVLDDGRVFRGRGVLWYGHPGGVLAPDWLARWLSAQSRTARTSRQMFMVEAKMQRRRERRHYGDN